MSEELKPVMFANKEFTKAEDALFMAMIADSEEGLCPLIRQTYCVPLYSQEQVDALLERIEDLRMEMQVMGEYD